MLTRAIAETLQAAPPERARLFERLVMNIHTFMAERPLERPWTCSVFTGTDGSRVFRGGIGHSLVVDPQGNLWRARSYEDFVTIYDHSTPSCDIATLTPLYSQMRRYSSREPLSSEQPLDA